MPTSNSGGAVKSQHVISNAGWNILGRIAPVFVALLVTPQLIALMGLSRWGIFTIALSLAGTFGIFDLGLGRALARAVANRPSGDTDPDTADLILTGVVTLTGIGVIGGLVCAGFIDMWVRNGLKMPQTLHTEVLLSLWVFCATAPLIMINAALWGVLTGYHAFKITNLINLPISITYYIGPLIALHFWNSLIGVMFVVAACRLWMAVSYIRFVYRLVPELRKAQMRLRLLAPLMRIGGWMTVSNVVFPILNYLDRFMIVSVISAAATSYYTTPADAVTRYNMLTQSVTASAFPAFASSWRQHVARTAELYKTSTLAVCATVFPLCLLTALFSHQILSVWISGSFAAHSSTVMKFLCLGVFLGGVDSISATFLDAIGRPDISAKISLVELVLYLPCLYFALLGFGVVGAAGVWALRMMLDYLTRSAICLRLYPQLRQRLLQGLPAILAGAAALCIGLAPLSTPLAVIAAITLPVIYYALLWFVCLNTDERVTFKALARRLIAQCLRQPVP